MSRSLKQRQLFPVEGPTDLVVVNERCLLRRSRTHCVVLVCGLPIAQFALGDRMAGAYAMVNLVDRGWADQNDVARAFGCGPRTLRRHQRRFEDGGLAALGRPGGYPTGRSRVAPSRRRRILRLKSAGRSNRAIARELGVDEKAIRKLLRRSGWKEPAPAAPDLFEPPNSSGRIGATPPGADPNLSAIASTSDPSPPSLDRDPTNRVLDRLLARLGLLNDAAPLFLAGRAVPRAGVLLALPSLVESGLLDIVRDVYGEIGPAFYGLRTTFVAMHLLALWRVKRPEALKEHPPRDLGRALGLDRVPEVKTLRRKLSRLGAMGRAVELGRELARRRVTLRGAAVGVLYVDGHVRIYHGRHTLPKAHVAQMRLCLPATTDYWVNDQQGDPLFVITAEANAGLVRMLPEVLSEIRRAVGDRVVTVVFDRGGWSPKLFRKILAETNFHILTYRKGRWPRLPRSRFRVRRARFDGRRVSYRLADHEVRLLGGVLRMRQVTRLSKDGLHQTPILTSRRDWRTIEVAYRMFERWRQENFFKYLGEEFALDALVDYSVEPADPQRDVPNPKWADLDMTCRGLTAQLVRAAAKYGLNVVLNPESRRPTIRGFKIANAAVGREIQRGLETLAAAKARRDRTPRRVPVGEAIQAPVVKLAAERKHLTNLVKMVAYQSEGDLVQIVAPHYRRAPEEGRTLIQSALLSAADLEVTKRELRIRLAPLSSAHRTRAIAALCEELDRKNVMFPGTRLRMRFSVADPSP